ALVIALIGAALLRTAWAVLFNRSMEQEGIEYCRIAENLLSGRGYVGIFNNGTQLNFPPLYPVLIAAVSAVVRNSAIAARIINIAFGAALVIPVCWIAQRLYGRRVAVTAAVLVVLHPVLIAGGASTYAEGPYLTLVMVGVACLIKCVLDNRPRASLAAGGFL